MPVHRLLITFALLAAACAVPGPSGQGPLTPAPGPTEATGPPTTLAQIPIDPPSALQDDRHPDFPEPLVDPDDILSGGPPPDGIPSIDEPQFVPVEAANAWLDPAEPVVILEIGVEARAYPVQVLIWHEIVNDTVAGRPVVVTYCPLCNSAVSYLRTVGGMETTFGTSGRLYASALVMYDRLTESLWTHYDGRAVVGALTGYQLEIVPSPLIAWEEFRTAHPDGSVLDREATGHSRPYGSNPYQGYDSPDGFPFLFRGDADARALAMQRVVGVEVGEANRAWTLEAVSGGKAQATHGEVGGQAVVIFWRAGQSSALADDEIAAGRDVGSVGVFVPEADGRSLTFRADGERLLDEETGSTWDVTGRATDGPLAGSTLRRLHHLDTFWFAWATYHPNTELVEG